MHGNSTFKESFDNCQHFYGDTKQVTQTSGSVKNNLRDLIRNSQSFILKYFKMLSVFDYQVCRMYFIDGMCQDQISKTHNITQAAISRRLRFSIHRVKFLIKMPNLNPISVRNDFRILFPEELFEIAYFFYWENTQNRVKYFIDISQSGASNRYRDILTVLDNYRNLSDEQVKDNPLLYKRKVLSLIYYEYFLLAKDKSNVVSFLFKRNDKIRVNNIYRGASVLETNEVKVL